MNGRRSRPPGPPGLTAAVLHDSTRVAEMSFFRSFFARIKQKLNSPEWEAYLYRDIAKDSIFQPTQHFRFPSPAYLSPTDSCFCANFRFSSQQHPDFSLNFPQKTERLAKVYYRLDRPKYLKQEATEEIKTSQAQQSWLPFEDTKNLNNYDVSKLPPSPPSGKPFKSSGPF